MGLRVGVESRAEVVEVRVDGDLHRRAQRDRPVGGAARVSAHQAALRERAGVDVDGVGRDDPGRESGGRRDDLEGRADRIGAGDRAVDQRVVLALAEGRVVRALRERSREQVRVVRRRGAHREHLAVARVERDERAASRGVAMLVRERDAGRERLLSGSLQPEVDRQSQVRAGDRLARRQVALCLSERVDLHTQGAVPAAQVAVVRVLEPGLPDDRAASHAAEVVLLQLRRVDLPDGPEQLRAEVPEAVVAQEHLLYRDAGELPRALGEIEGHLPRDVRLDRHVGVRQIPHPSADEAVELHHAQHVLAHAAPLRPRRHADYAAQAGQQARTLGRRLGQLRRRDDDGDRAPVLHQRGAATVDHLAARRLHLDVAHAVARSLCEVLVAREHLQEPQAEEHDREQRERDAAEDGDAHGELGRDRRAALLRRREACHLSGLPTVAGAARGRRSCTRGGAGDAGPPAGSPARRASRARRSAARAARRPGSSRRPGAAAAR